MKSQAVMVSAFLASLLVILLVVFYYINIFPYSTTINIRMRNYDVYSIVLTKVAWSARELAYTLQNTLIADEVIVNITVINITENYIVKTDYYAIISQDVNVTLIYNFEISRLEDTGLFYKYTIRVGFR